MPRITAGKTIAAQKFRAFPAIRSCFCGDHCSTCVELDLPTARKNESSVEESMIIVPKACVSLFLASLSIVLFVSPLQAQTRRAVLVGINTYVPKISAEDTSSARASARVQKSSPGRACWRHLAGSLNDVASLRQLHITRFGFEDS